jgi:tRNA threonylcarbamoyladenosine biosynthesis protein TsaE
LGGGCVIIVVTFDVERDLRAASFYVFDIILVKQVTSVKGVILTKHSQEEMSLTLDSISHSAAQTQRMGMRLGELLQGGELILLDGQLGTGKTTFTQGLALGMGITENINSPTFTLLKEYAGRLRPGAQPGAQPCMGPALYHFDLYRLDNAEEIVDLGFEDYFYSTGVCVVEWAEKADSYWPAEHLNVRMKMMTETKRGLLFIATGERYCELLRQFQKNTYVTTGS